MTTSIIDMNGVMAIKRVNLGAGSSDRIAGLSYGSPAGRLRRSPRRRRPPKSSSGLRCHMMPGERYDVIVVGLGIGSWSTGQLVAYLRDGSNHQVIASGPMAEVVVNSTSHMPECDLIAITTYLIDGASVEELASLDMNNDNPPIRMGRAIYKNTGAACHGDTGRGTLGLFPKLAGHPALQQVDPSTLIRVVLAGGCGGTTDACLTAAAMPPLGWRLDDPAIASVLTFTRNARSIAAPPITEGGVRTMRCALASQ